MWPWWGLCLGSVKGLKPVCWLAWPPIVLWMPWPYIGPVDRLSSLHTLPTHRNHATPLPSHPGRSADRCDSPGAHRHSGQAYGRSADPGHPGQRRCLPVDL